MHDCKTDLAFEHGRYLGFFWARDWVWSGLDSFFCWILLVSARHSGLDTLEFIEVTRSRPGRLNSPGVIECIFFLSGRQYSSECGHGVRGPHRILVMSRLISLEHFTDNQ